MVALWVAMHSKSDPSSLESASFGTLQGLHTLSASWYLIKESGSVSKMILAHISTFKLVWSASIHRRYDLPDDYIRYATRNMQGTALCLVIGLRGRDYGTGSESASQSRQRSS